MSGGAACSGRVVVLDPRSRATPPAAVAGDDDARDGDGPTFDDSLPVYNPHCQRERFDSHRTQGLYKRKVAPRYYFQEGRSMRKLFAGAVGDGVHRGSRRSGVRRRR